MRRISYGRAFLGGTALTFVFYAVCVLMSLLSIALDGNNADIKEMLLPNLLALIFCPVGGLEGIVLIWLFGKEDNKEKSRNRIDDTIQIIQLTRKDFDKQNEDSVQSKKEDETRYMPH